MAVPRDVRDESGAARLPADGGDSWAWPAPLDGVARWAMRVPWLWPTLLTLLLGCYQLGRPELWADELWSWSFAADPVHALVVSASRSNPAELVYDLALHYWMAAFGDSVVAMRLLSVLAMAGAAACVTLAARRLAWRAGGPAGGAGVRSCAERVAVRSGGPVLRAHGARRGAGHAAAAAGP